ncbi:MAG TPA: nuclear transport factor 2 family protein [Blastocatellia bacterium]
MADTSRHRSAAAVMDRINSIWLDGRVEDLEPLIHPDMIMVFPGFEGQVQGRDQFLAGFRDFCENARVHEFSEGDRRVDLAGDMCVVTFRYEMVYERAGAQYHSTGRDLWVFQRHNEDWLGVWRTMLEVEEAPV